MKVGLYGKLPSHGDFLRRRTSDAFVGAWDAWLQECMAASRTLLGARWLDVYLTSPAWRFSAAAGVCGPAPVLGLMVPSVDRVGRYFPLTIAAELPPGRGLPGVHGAGPFFSNAERLVIETLAADTVDFETFDRGVADLADDLAFLRVPGRVRLEPEAAAVLDGDGHAVWQVPLASVEDLAPAFEQLLFARLSATYNPLMFWWSDGSSNVEPSCLITRGLPNPAAFTGLLDGAWSEHRWRTVAARIHTGAPDVLLGPGHALSFRSAGASDVGRVRQINQDAFLERSEVGLWAVADGLGGHSNGERASRMVCDALADFTPDQSFENSIEAVRARMQAVNDHLLLDAGRSLRGERSGSTVVALLVRGGRCAVLWVGDSRVYRLRSGRLQQLTRDHSPPEGGSGTGPQESYAVTRAVGAQSALEIDLYGDQVVAGDRFLLCSDGLTRAVPESRIATLMESADLRTSVDGLVAATLALGAPDNVTALIVEAFDDRTPLLGGGLPDESL